ncbi:pentapeptide repeat-containing protein [Streptomyces sp. PsTaAH-137]|uniref:pentapeptide repeat-containing protein n=1 Tax=Streptomyces sp. PsTaAH-137 TaxID=1305830 RepID=UPI000DBAD05D
MRRTPRRGREVRLGLTAEPARPVVPGRLAETTRTRSSLECLSPVRRCRRAAVRADVSGAVFTEADLRHALLARAGMAQAHMADPDLRGALLNDATLRLLFTAVRP